MAHYALINSNNIVVQVITGVDEHIIQTDLDGTQVGGSSEAWETFYENLPWFSGLKCKRTSYNKNIRKHFACVGYIYNEYLDAFIPPKPYQSWVLNEEKCLWYPPVLMPDNFDKDYAWNESTQEWVEKPNDGNFYFWDNDKNEWVNNANT